MSKGFMFDCFTLLSPYIIFTLTIIVGNIKNRVNEKPDLKCYLDCSNSGDPKKPIVKIENCGFCNIYNFNILNEGYTIPKNGWANITLNNYLPIGKTFDAQFEIDNNSFSIDYECENKYKAKFKGTFVVNIFYKDKNKTVFNYSKVDNKNFHRVYKTKIFKSKRFNKWS